MTEEQFWAILRVSNSEEESIVNENMVQSLSEYDYDLICRYQTEGA